MPRHFTPITDTEARMEAHAHAGVVLAVLAHGAGRIASQALVLVAIPAGTAMRIGCGLCAPPTRRFRVSRSSLVAATLLLGDRGICAGLRGAALAGRRRAHPTRHAKRSPQILQRAEPALRRACGRTGTGRSREARRRRQGRLPARTDRRMVLAVDCPCTGYRKPNWHRDAQRDTLRRASPAFADVAIKSLKSETLAGIPGERLTLEV